VECIQNAVMYAKALDKSCSSVSIGQGGCVYIDRAEMHRSCLSRTKDIVQCTTRQAHVPPCGCRFGAGSPVVGWLGSVEPPHRTRRPGCSTFTLHFPVVHISVRAPILDRNAEMATADKDYPAKRLKPTLACQTCRMYPRRLEHAGNVRVGRCDWLACVSSRVNASGPELDASTTAGNVS
jgi:hypothetical protein